MPRDLAVFFVEQAEAIALEDIDVAIDSVRNALCCKMSIVRQEELIDILKMMELVRLRRKS